MLMLLKSITPGGYFDKAWHHGPCIFIHSMDRESHVTFSFIPSNPHSLLGNHSHGV